MNKPEHARFVTQRVQFHDCDPLGIVWHGRYFEYFEAARCELLRSVHLDVADMIELNLRMVVTEVRCRYNTPMRCGDELRVWAWFSELEPLLRVSYDIENLSTKRRCVRAFTRLALTDARGTLLPVLPPVVRSRLPASIEFASTNRAADAHQQLGGREP